VVRWTIPRFRFDQLMRLAWKGLVPMTMAIAAVQGMVIYAGWPQWVSLPANVLVLTIAGYLGAASGKPITGRQQSMQRAEAIV
jgi:NADH-quinone oxidoreductase subunit H